jgi:hypothetical protein
MLAEVLEDELLVFELELLVLETELELMIELELATTLDDVATDELATELGAADEGVGVEPPPPPPQAISEQLKNGMSKCLSVFMVSL